MEVSSIQVDHPACDMIFLGVKADDEACDDEHAGAVDFVDAVGEAPPVFCFFCIDTSVSLSGLSMPTNTMKKLSLSHHRQQLVVIGEIERGFRRELERIAMLLLPRDRARGRNAFTAFLLPMKLSSTKSSGRGSRAIERVELGQHLRRRLDPRRAAVELDDVAELAGERTAARELDIQIQVVASLY